MSLSLKELKARSKENLQKMAAANKTTSTKDDRYWSPQRGQDGNGYAVIRFLPIPKIDSDKTEALPYVKIYRHSFKGDTTGKYYIENSLTTFGEKDPVGDYNSKLWNEGNEAQARKQKRTLNYYSNIFVVRDPLNPDNEGKVFLFKYGKKIYDKIMQLIDPEEITGEEASDVFDFDTGRNFKLKIKTVSDYPNYDSSEFDSPGPIADKSGKALSEEEVEKIYESCNSLLELLDRKHFKSFEELQKKMNDVLGLNGHESNTVHRNSEPERRVTSETKSAPIVDDSDEDTEALINSLMSDD